MIQASPRYCLRCSTPIQADMQHCATCYLSIEALLIYPYKIQPQTSDSTDAALQEAIDPTPRRRQQENDAALQDSIAHTHRRRLL